MLVGADGRSGAHLFRSNGVGHNRGLVTGCDQGCVAGVVLVVVGENNTVDRPVFKKGQGIFCHVGLAGVHQKSVKKVHVNAHEGFANGSESKINNRYFLKFFYGFGMQDSLFCFVLVSVVEQYTFGVGLSIFCP
jgi:hypothetical protein